MAGDAGVVRVDPGEDAEYSNIGVNMVLLILAAVVAWGRFGPYSF
ncbi:hypothetical protein FHR83_006619 [Actinoplanes campanulatus]|uniref:Uncharacterized protein n=1 Tax=Actinoplanes campanulatus TaxID=113559 RepID=A0A7W5AMB8_9ACTN|nr:hypothetical protein [Actinoplanes campanulatus]MBB3098913.1 hypothetical protein [Actinoplanes campanulatus]GGN39908.1 hypothetical protein GCM10010109_68370 [Actinoplanes campanulatus]GID40117.1 hypothetical protein Aca09nite_66230 [Actinoplanes campanulatus]